MRNLFLLFFLFCFIIVVNAQQRPKVGLVLSGGGAKGMAHIGLLKVLEELNIEPDYITGTSMGAIVGGLYSIGYSAHEIDSIVREADWPKILRDRVLFRNVDMNEKHDYMRSMLTLYFDKKKSPGLPSGLIHGFNISERMSSLTWRVAHLKSFEEYKYPFRCMSADLLSGKPVQIKDGSLATAMRASMSIPTVFVPVEYDSMLLVDGGVYRNFPVEEAIEFGADYIIGSYTGLRQEVDYKHVNNLSKIFVRSSVFARLEDAKNQIDKCDVAVFHELSGLGIADFDKSPEIIDLGEKKTREKETYEKLVKLSLELKKFDAVKRYVPAPVNSIIIAGFKSKGLKTLNEKYLYDISGLKVGMKIVHKDMSNAIERIMATMLFDKVEYSLEKRPDGYVINFDVIEKHDGQIKLSLHYDNYYGAGIIGNIIYRNLLINGSKIQIKSDISEYPIFFLSFSMNMGRKRSWFAGINNYTEYTPIRPEIKPPGASIPISIGKFLRNYRSTEIKIGRNLRPTVQMGINTEFLFGKAILKEGLNSVMGYKSRNYKGFNLGFFMKINSLNRQLFPTRGAVVDVKAMHGSNYKYRYKFEENNKEDSIQLSVPFTQLSFNWKHFFTIGKSSTIIPLLGFGLSYNEPGDFEYFHFGGQFDVNRRNNSVFVGYEPFYLSASNYLLAGLGFRQQIVDNLYLGVKSNVMFYNRDNIFPKVDLTEKRKAVGFSANASYKSLFGPISFGVAYNSEYNKYYWNVMMGYRF